MIKEVEISVVPYSLHHRRAVLAFIRQQHRTHYHLDWHPVLNWLKTTDNLAVVAHDQHRKLVGVLALTTPIEGVAWIRLVSLHNNAPTWVFASMMAQVKAACRETGIAEIATIESEPWLLSFLLANGFSLMDHIVHLGRLANSAVPIVPITSDVEIQPAHLENLIQVEAIDHASFGPHWQMQLPDLQEAVKNACWFNLAMLGNQPVGYQIAVPHGEVIHLTRLAVLPQFQGRGVGRALVASLVERFPNYAMTVNTQASNLASQHIYERFGFRHQDWVNPVWNMVL